MIRIRFAVVDDNGNEIDTDGGTTPAAPTRITADCPPRVGDSILLYRRDPSDPDSTWTVVAVTWMVRMDSYAQDGDQLACVRVEVRQR